MEELQLNICVNY